MQEQYKTASLKQQGFTLMELLAVFMVVSIIAGTAVSNLKILNNPLNDASLALTHFVKLARARAVSQTKAILITPASSVRLKIQTASTCSGTMTDVPDFFYDMPDTTSFIDTAWSACFTSRGLATSNEIFSIRNEKGGMNEIEIALGGGVRVK